MSLVGQTRTCLTVGASSAFPPVADIQGRQTGFWEHRPAKEVKRSCGASTELLQRVVARTAEVARSKLVERTGVQRFHFVTLHSHLWTKRSFAQRVLNGFGGLRG